MVVYSPLLPLTMHHAVYELADATQWPVLLEVLTTAQLEGRLCLLLYYCNVLPCQNRVLYVNISHQQLHFTTY